VPAFPARSKEFIARIERERCPAFARTDLAVGTFPENTLTQLARFDTLTRCMSGFGAVLAGNTAGLDAILDELKTVWPARRAEFTAMQVAWRDRKQVPGAKLLFGVNLVPLSPIRIDGTVWPVGGETVSSQGKDETVYDFRRELPLCMAGVEGPERYRVSVSRDGKNFSEVKTAISGDALVWRPEPARYLRLSGPPPVKIRAFAAKSGDTVECCRMTGDWKKNASWNGLPRVGMFTTPFGSLEPIPASAAMACDDRQLYFNFKLPGSSAAGNQVQLAVNPNPDEVAFFEVTVGQDGKITASRHGYENSVKKDIEAVSVRTGDTWECTFVIPFDWLGMERRDLPKAAVNFLVKSPEGRDFSSWMPLPPPAKFWHNKQPTGKISVVESIPNTKK